MTDTSNYRRYAKIRGDRHCQVVLSAEAHTELLRLVQHHRLDRREVVQRLILGIPLDRVDTMTEQVRLGMSDPEYSEFLRIRRVYSHNGKG